MKHAVYLPTFYDFSDPEKMLEIAVAADQSGWDGVFLWDHLALNDDGSLEILDATVMLGAIAQATTTVGLGAMITPLARRRPWKLAKELATLNRLSGGRVTLGVGLGEPAHFEFSALGENPRQRASRLDEGLEVLRPLLKGARVSYTGRYYNLNKVQFAPPASGPGKDLPVWVATCLPATAGLTRAARYEGVFPIKVPASLKEGASSEIDWSQWWMTAAELGESLEVVKAHRGSLDGFDVVASGRVAHDDSDRSQSHIDEFRAVGASWWFEWIDETPGTFEASLAAVRRGPPG